MDSSDFPLIAQHFTVSDTAARFYGTVESDSVLYPVVSVCGRHRVSYTVSVFFDNLNSLLDSRVIPYLVLAPFSFAIFAVLGICSSCTSVARRRPRNSLHADFRATLFSAILFFFFEYWELLHFSSSDDETAVTFARLFFQTLQSVCFLAMELVLAAGVSLIRIDVPASDRFRALFTSSCVVFPSALVDLFGTPKQTFRFEFVSTFIGLRLYFLLKLFQRFNSAIGLLFWDTRVLGADEIAAKAGALQRFRSCFSRSFGYAVALTVLWSIDDIELLGFWLSRFIQDAIWFIALSDYAWLAGRQPGNFGFDGDGWPVAQDTRS
jgi:hypothetical protein